MIASKTYYVLVDTSIWIEVFRREQSLDLEKLLDFDRVVTCLPVIQEILQGIRSENAFRLARSALLALPVFDSPTSLDTVELAVDLYRRGRSLGFTVRSSVDCLIAATALRHNLTVLHRDRDFETLAKYSELQQISA